MALDIVSTNGGADLEGSMSYRGEGPISFRSNAVAGGVYETEIRWGGVAAPWHDNGIWVMGSRPSQGVMAVELDSDDGGATLTGSIRNEGEGDTGFAGERYASNNCVVVYSWGGSSGHDGGTLLLGCREGQCVMAVEAFSNDGGNTLTGTMSYLGEGPVSFRATQLALVQP